MTDNESHEVISEHEEGMTTTEEQDMVEELISANPLPMLIGEPTPHKRTCHNFITETKLIKRIRSLMGHETAEFCKDWIYNLTGEMLDEYIEKSDQELKLLVQTQITND